jgi:hypothetical protein
LIKPLFHHALKHSNASIMLSPREFLSGVMSFFALLKARSHSKEPVLIEVGAIQSAQFRTIGRLPDT